MCFSALLVISYVDQQYYDSIEHPLKTKFEEEAQYQMPITSKEIKKKERAEMSLLSQCGYASVKALKFVYETVYFHFMPYIALMYINFLNIFNEQDYGLN